MFEKDETLDEERGKVVKALEELLGPEGELVNTTDPWNECFLEQQLIDVRRLLITYGGPSVHIEVNLTENTGEYVRREGLGQPEIRVSLSPEQVATLRNELGLEPEVIY